MGIRFKVDGKLVDEKINIKPLEIQVADNIEHWKAQNPQSLVDTGYPQPGSKMKNEKIVTTSEGIEVGIPNEEFKNRLWELINENTELKQQLYFAEHRLEQIKRLLEE